MQLVMRHVLTILLLQVLFPILSYGQPSNASPSFALAAQYPLWIDLSGSWQVIFQDRAEFAEPGYDDHAWQSIALAPNDAPRLWIDISPVAIFSGLGNASFEEIQIEVLFPARETSRHDL